MSRLRIQSPDDFLVALGRLPLAANPAHVAADLGALRLAFPDEAGFLGALQAVLDELSHAVARPTGWGVAMTGHYSGWRRSAFQSQRTQGRPAELRLVFRSMADGRLELRAFGHRWLPEEVYLRGTSR